MRRLPKALSHEGIFITTIIDRVCLQFRLGRLDELQKKSIKFNYYYFGLILTISFRTMLLRETRLVNSKQCASANYIGYFVLNWTFIISQDIRAIIYFRPASLPVEKKSLWFA